MAMALKILAILLKAKDDHAAGRIALRRALAIEEKELRSEHERLPLVERTGMRDPPSSELDTERAYPRPTGGPSLTGMD